MKILIYGAGVIGSIFAAKLSLSGQEVSVLARGLRLEELHRQGVLLTDPRTGKQETAHVAVIEKLLPDEYFDYILVVMKRTQVDEILDDLARNCSPNIIFIVNTAAGYDEWQARLGKRLMIGFPAAGGERKDGAVSYFIFHGPLLLIQTTTFGEITGEISPRVRALIHMFRKAGIPSAASTNIDAWQKTHVAVVTAIANALFLHDCDNKKLVSSPPTLRALVGAVREGFTALKRLGISPTPRRMGVFFLPTGLLMVVLKLIMRTQFAEFTMAKHCVVARDEMQALQKELDALITRSGIQAPHSEYLKHGLYLYKISGHGVKESQAR